MVLQAFVSDLFIFFLRGPHAGLRLVYSKKKKKHQSIPDFLSVITDASQFDVIWTDTPDQTTCTLIRVVLLLTLKERD